LTEPSRAAPPAGAAPALRELALGLPVGVAAGWGGGRLLGAPPLRGWTVALSEQLAILGLALSAYWGRWPSTATASSPSSPAAWLSAPGRVHGEVYRAYRRSGLPFFVPRPGRGARDTASSS
jgi:hypothetical protein